ncbi:hypothetical protein LJC38_07750, partial [Parabacteroides sp. OttesenSCG-928-K15]|nr:hypothetical protein [Parabacteroides sp. OttesenSCG-928-K15]
MLHDPPGSNSYSYLEKGTSFTKATTYSFVGGQSAEASIVTKLGTKLTTWSGVGAGVSQENEVTNESDIGVTETTTYKYADQTETVTTYTERFQTSADPLYVGHSGDVFVGNSTNIQYGETNSITILHKDELAEATNGSLYEPLGNTDYVIGKSKGLAFGLKFDTRFAYTEMEIKETYIPKWKNLIRSMLQVAEPKQEDLTTPYYWSQLDAEDENFGKSNKDEEAFGEEAKKSDYKNGPSYRIVFPIGYEESEAMDEFCDSIQYYHDQINMWESVLAENERNKVNMELLGNYSFGGGSQIEYSTFESGTHTTSHDFSFVLSPKVAGKAGGEFAGLGITFRMSTTVSVGTEDSWSSSETETKTIGFVLDDNGLTDQISVDYGKTEAGMIAFKSRGGRTSCPYEPEVRTEYYEPGVHVLSEATMQVDVPVLTVKGGSTRLRVPSHRPASFVLELKNESEIDWDNYYVLLMDDTTNPYGAVVKIDGTPIGNGRTVFLPAGEVTEKTITIEKGPDQNLYENIRIKLAAECQQLSLFDDVLLSVEFLPSCSDISFKLPNENWVVNSVTGDTLDIILEGYDVNYNNFTYVELEYKELSSANWIKLQKFYLDSVAGYDPDKHILLAETDTDIRYRWKMSQLPDGKY